LLRVTRGNGSLFYFDVLYFDPFSSREPVSTSLENTIEYVSHPAGHICFWATPLDNTKRSASLDLGLD
jgi:hypothetical protein